MKFDLLLFCISFPYIQFDKKVRKGGWVGGWVILFVVAKHTSTAAFLLRNPIVRVSKIYTYITYKSAHTVKLKSRYN